nr:MAG TPA: hypothetical protein [Caudoviricetes sp.]
MYVYDRGLYVFSRDKMRFMDGETVLTVSTERHDPAEKYPSYNTDKIIGKVIDVDTLPYDIAHDAYVVPDVDAIKAAVAEKYPVDCATLDDGSEGWTNIDEEPCCEYTYGVCIPSMYNIPDELDDDEQLEWWADHHWERDEGEPEWYDTLKEALAAADKAFAAGQPIPWIYIQKFNVKTGDPEYELDEIELDADEDGNWDMGSDDPLAWREYNLACDEDEVDNA